MKKNCITILIIIFFAFSPLVVTAQIPFGGLVTYVYPCNTGLLAYIATAPAGIIVPFMWFWGELPFLSHIPPHPGQMVLGMAASVVVPCVLGVYPVGAGLPIIYHGSSL